MSIDVGKPIEEERKRRKIKELDLSKVPAGQKFRDAAKPEDELVKGKGPEETPEQPEHPMAKTLRSLADKVEAGSCITVLLSAAFMNEPPLTITHGNHWGSKLAMMKRLNLKVDDEFAHETFPRV